MKFNQVSKGKNQVFNYGNAPAYRLSPEWNLYTSVVTSMVSEKYYETASDRLEMLRNLIRMTDPQFVARLAIYARDRMNLRSIPLVLAVELAKIHSGDSLIQKMTEKIIQRADEITELLAYYQMANDRKATKKLNRLSKQIQAGLQNAFNKFDEYQFAKYNRDTEIKFRDALFLVHPKAKNDEQQLIFDKIAGNKLQTPYTWETELSALGQNKFESIKAKKEAFTRKWEELIDSGKVGYMALLRNLRNILEADVSALHIHRVCETISDKEKVLQSKQFPFRFLAAYRELSQIDSDGTVKKMKKEIEMKRAEIEMKRKPLENMFKIFKGDIAKINELLMETAEYREYRELLSEDNKLLTEYNELLTESLTTKDFLPEYIISVKNALEDAVKAAAGNIAGFDETTKVLIACDVSGSMQQAISPNSKMMNYDIGLMLGMLLKSRCENAVCGIFGDTWKIVNLPDSGILSNVDEFYKREGEVGYSTNGHLVIEDLINREEVMDKIMIFTDCQLWDSTGKDIRLKDVWQKYKTIAPKARLYLFDLAGYGRIPLDITNDDVRLIAGWSDKIFDILQAIDHGSDALKEIRAIEI